MLRDRRGTGGWRGCSRDAVTPSSSPLLSPPALPVRDEMVSAPELAQGGGAEMEVPLPEEQAEAGTADLKDTGPGATTDVQGTSIC